MSSAYTSISPDKPSRLVGTAAAPALSEGAAWHRCSDIATEDNGRGRTVWVTQARLRIKGIASVSLKILVATLASVLLAGVPAGAESQDGGPLQLEAKILLGHVRGRIDHMAVDLKRQRLFIAELGNDSVGIVDLANRSVIHTISGLKEPQGVGYEPTTDTVFVANAKDGTVKLFDGNDYRAAGQIELGRDADNIRIDVAARVVIVGYGKGSLGYIDPVTRSKVRSSPLKAHPESFQLDPDTNRIFINLPGAHAVAVVDGKSGRQLANWPVEKSGNYAMAIDRERNALLIAFREPPELGVLELSGGKSVATVETCRDVDDLFVDARRKRIYVSCGQGFVDVFEANGATYRQMARVPTVAGARTSLFVPEMDRLIVAVRESLAGPAAIWILRPRP
ncbi:YncE family protein [Bradyrhizobium vignae]|uniref:YncE family protein n=1 Tax=Bradyrhizobium vignae TaxID=1549949 RepID=A0A2U3QAV5_9BRAD|nr:hypothetical protein [Bradyrhizobium vignae]SPP98542.1 conserved protein of unknown function [Bradyrhizobium vignae]